MSQYRVELLVDVHDKQALYKAAVKYAVEHENMSQEEAEEHLNDDGIDVGACLQMVLDPGSGPDGCSILESSSECVDGDKEG